MIYEVKYIDEKIFPSTIVAGGRYDNLVEKMSGIRTPMIGVSFGLDRIYDLLTIMNKIPSYNNGKKKYYVASIGDNLDQKRLQVSTALRRKGLVVITNYDSNPKLKKQIKRAISEDADYLIIVDQQINNNKVGLKNLKTKEQVYIELDQI